MLRGTLASSPGGVTEVQPIGPRQRFAWFALASALGSGCDLHTKAWAERTLQALPRQSMEVVDPWLDLTLAYNRGTAFSLISDLGAARWVFGALAIAVVVGLIVMLLRQATDRMDAIAMGSIAAGAVGNGFDRVFRLAPGGGTGVIDFVQVNYPWGGHWPLFNVADALLVVGVGVLVVRRWTAGREAQPGSASAA